MYIRTILMAITCCGLATSAHAQVLIDSIPYPGINQGFWGIHVNADTVFLGADFSGNIYFSDHQGAILGQLPTGLNFNHGLIRRPTSYLIAEDFTTGGAGLYEVSLAGALLNTWTFPPVIGGNSSGIGDLCADGNAVWYTMYYPDFSVYPYAYAYKWIPGDPAPIDTVPLHGEQPYGIALKGDTLFYVTDNLNGDQERIYAYDLTNEQDIGWIELPDTPIDNDQSPRGLFYDGELLYLIANRQGGNAFAYQTVFILGFDASTAVWVTERARDIAVYPVPTKDMLFVRNALNEPAQADLLDASGRVVRQLTLASGTSTVDISALPAGSYVLRVVGGAALRVVVR